MGNSYRLQTTVVYVRDIVTEQPPAGAGKINADRVIKTPNSQNQAASKLELFPVNR